MVRFRAMSPDQQEAPAPEKQKAEERQEVQPSKPKAAETEKAPPPPVPEPQPRPQPSPPPAIAIAPPKMPAANIAPRRPEAPAAAPPAANRQTFGPPDSGGGARDTPLVGTGPNGERLYAASWYREPYEDELSGYLSTASGPGWGLIACRTAPDFRVEDCVLVDEYPTGSNIGRAVLAAAWQFRVRPPRIGGEPKIGEWVRIRIDYGQRRR